MADEAETLAEENAVVTAEAGDESNTAAEQTPEEQARIEERARMLGWRPPGEFKGEPGNFVEAADFLQKAQENMPLLKQQNRRLDEALRDATKREKRLEKMIGELKGFEERAYQRAVAELEARHDAAVEEGDVAKSRAIRKEIDGLRPAPKAAEQDTETDPRQAKKELAEWVDRNDWYVTDTARRQYADIQAEAMGPATEWEGGQKEWLAEIEKRVGRKFADKPPNPVNGGGNRQPSKGAGKGYADLDAEGKKMADDMERMGVMTKAEYAKEYWAHA